MIKKLQRNITDFIKQVYYDYFGMKLGDEDKSWVPHKVYYVCVEDQRKWSKGKKKAFRFGFPVIWREPKIAVMIASFAVAMLRVITLKMRKLCCI
jgi:hypothetical protein